MRIHNEADWQLQESGLIENIITFNGQGSAGKSTQAKRLVKIRSGLYTYVLAHALRDDFKKNFYDQLNRPEQLGIEVLGFPSLPWLTAYFHWQLKPILLNGSILVFDHYLGDHYADMLPSGSAENFKTLLKIVWVYLTLIMVSTSILMLIIVPIARGRRSGQKSGQNRRVKIILIGGVTNIKNSVNWGIWNALMPLCVRTLLLKRYKRLWLKSLTRSAYDKKELG